jgi:hypothetical protein
MNPMMDVPRFFRLVESQRDQILHWLQDELGTEAIFDVELVDEGTVRVSRLLRSHLQAVWPTTGCEPFPLHSVRYRVAPRTPPPWADPTWDEPDG